MEQPFHAVSRWLRRFLAPTRTRLAVQALMVAVLLSGIGMMGVLTDHALQRAGRDQTTTAAQLSDDAQAIYRLLAEADTAATGRFLARDNASQGDLRQRYDTDIDQIRQRLISAAGLTGGDPDRAAGVARVALQLPVYTALVDKAQKMIAEATSLPSRALLGAAYLREASSYLRTVLLPAADQLWQDEISRLGQARSTARWTVGSELLLLLAGLGALTLIQWSLARRTHRVVNLGILGAAVAILVALGVTGWSLRDWPTADQRLGVVGRQLGTQRDLVGVERSALAAHADTYLRLGGHTTRNSDEFRSHFRTDASCQTAKQPSTAGADPVATWCVAYDRWIHQTLAQGNNDLAVTAALPKGAVAVAFEAVDHDLTESINRGAREILDRADTVPAAPPRLGFLIVLLCVGAAGSAGFGFWIRIKDYL